MVSRRISKYTGWPKFRLEICSRLKSSNKSVAGPTQKDTFEQS